MRKRWSPVAVLALIAVTLAAAGCSAPGNRLVGGCPVTPDSTYTAANGQELGGKRGGNIFFYLYFGGPGEPREFQANRLETVILYFDHLASGFPDEVMIQGLNLTTGRREDFKATGPARSTYGVDWKANFIFPEPGCWRLTVDEPVQGEITVAVKDGAQ